jgi:hypothetical protein
MTDLEPGRNRANEFNRAFVERLRGDGKTSWNQLVRQTGIPRTTLRGWTKNKTAISAEQVAEALRAVGADEEEVTAFLDRRDAAAEEQPQLGSVTVATPAAATRRRWVERVAIAVVSAAVGAAVTAVVMGHSEDVPVQSVTPSRSENGQVCDRPLDVDLRDDAVSTRVGETGGNGVYTYRGPGRDYCRGPALPEGKPIRVVCLKVDGQVVRDRFGDELVESAVWDKLDSGTWIPHIYSALPRTDGALVAGLDHC